MTSPTPLDALIRATIARSGPMPVSRYMELCLTHPEFGYYVTRSPIGRDGDFTTAPEVSQMFGELIGLWAASIWNEMGMPEEIQFVELGPGRGTMMADALRAIRILPALQAAVSVHLVELSPVLRTAQRATLGEVDRIHWYDRLDDVPARPSIIFANEYFDALPVHQAVKCEHGWCERVIDVADDQLVYGVAKEPLTRFDVLLPPLVRAAPNGAIYEWRQDAEVMSLARRLRNHGGAALIIDYGHSRSEAGDTFQAVARHNFADPLQAPGKADLTAHVDFQALASAADSIGARVHGPVEQGVFLNNLGIVTRAQTLVKQSNGNAAESVTAALKRLTSGGKDGMGSLFKVLAISHPSIKQIAALSDQPKISD